MLIAQAVKIKSGSEKDPRLIFSFSALNANLFVIEGKKKDFVGCTRSKMEMTLMPSGSALLEAFYVVLISIFGISDERKIVLNSLSSFLESYVQCENRKE